MCRNFLKEITMELMQNIAKMQSSQMSKASDTADTAEVAKVAVQQAQVQKAAEQAEQTNEVEQSRTQKVESQDQMDALIKQLNHALDPFRTSLRFGFDNSSEDFYVSVIETQSNTMLRRFPAERAMDLLPKIQDLNGFLFDEIG